MLLLFLLYDRPSTRHPGPGQQTSVAKLPGPPSYCPACRSLPSAVQPAILLSTCACVLLCVYPSEIRPHCIRARALAAIR